MTCELFSEENGGCEAVVQVDGEWLLGRRFLDDRSARDAADHLRREYLRGSWSDEDDITVYEKEDRQELDSQTVQPTAMITCPTCGTSIRLTVERIDRDGGR